MSSKMNNICIELKLFFEHFNELSESDKLKLLDDVMDLFPQSSVGKSQFSDAVVLGVFNVSVDYFLISSGEVQENIAALIMRVSAYMAVIPADDLRVGHWISENATSPLVEYFF